jgi:hypothetical protein
MSKPATALQVARYGHIAAAIRQAMQQRSMTPRDVSNQLGLHKTATTVYPWINGIAAPVPKYHSKLMRVLGLTKEQITARDVDPPPSTALVVAKTQPKRSMNVDKQRQLHTFSMVMMPNGQCHVHIDMLLPWELALAIATLIKSSDSTSK